jgi:bifunctional enzyme CysN/CysC
MCVITTLADLVWIRAVVLEDEVDASRGDVIAAASHPVESADQFEVDLFWMSEHALLPGRPYAALIHTKSASVW